MAASKDGGLLAEVIRDIYAQTGVPLLVIPQDREAIFGYVGAHSLLGDQLLTSHVLDLGGGSLQIASAKESFGLPLGQKTWHETLCVKFRGKSQCDLQPMAEAEIEVARDFALLQFRGIQEKFSEPIDLTAVSRPVTRTLAPVVQGLTGGISEKKYFTLNALVASIDIVAKQTSASLADGAVVAGVSSRYIQFVLTDMLLVEGLLKSIGASDLRFAEIELTNVPGLIADSQVSGWRGDFDCYLKRFQNQGEAAFYTDVSTCRQ
jgi:exopolyphosphatase/pppGpp-phosphohydrolase